MSGRHREREHDRRAHVPVPVPVPASAPLRNNEYFLPKDGIDREVITSDICRYLGNDALVRPGVYNNVNGYFITGYRNLTTAMISDLKADSIRWESERRGTTSMGPPPNARTYNESSTHQNRQYYGPTGASQPASGPPQGGYASATTGSGFYNDDQYLQQQSQQQQQQQQQSNYGQHSQQAPGQGYSQPGYPPAQENYYVSGANFNVAESSPARVPVSQPVNNVPRSNASNMSYSGTPPYQQNEVRNQYQNQGPPISSAPTYPVQQAQDPYYVGRGAYRHETKPPIYREKREVSNFLAAPATDDMYPQQDSYDNRSSYQESGSYPQTSAAVSQPTPAVVPNTSSRRSEHHTRETEPRDRHNGHRNSRRS